MNGDMGVAILFLFFFSIGVNVTILWNMFTGHLEIHEKIDSRIIDINDQLLRRIISLEKMHLESQQAAEVDEGAREESSETQTAYVT